MLSAKEHLGIRESFTQEVSVKRSQGLMNKHLVGEEKKPAFQGEGRLHCKGWKQIECLGTGSYFFMAVVSIRGG